MLMTTPVKHNRTSCEKHRTGQDRLVMAYEVDDRRYARRRHGHHRPEEGSTT